MTWLDRAADKLWTQIVATVEELRTLDPRGFLERGEEQKSGGLKSKAYDGVQIRATGGRPIPVGDDGGQKDPYDREIDRENRAYQRDTEQVYKLVNALLEREKQRRGGRQIEACGDCDKPVSGVGSDRLRLGLCEPCYRRKNRRSE